MLINSEVANILIIGSAPSAIVAKNWDLRFFQRIITINNAWKITPFWTDSIFPDDFPPEKRPKANRSQKLHSANDYVPAQNHYGGFVYAGGTMAFTAAYWSLYMFSPSLIAYLGCDMVYSGRKTHFYGKGTPDPLRKDKTLKDLNAKSARFECTASKQECSVINLSNLSESKLVHRKSTLSKLMARPYYPRKVDEKKYTAALDMEKNLGYYIPDGRYWKSMALFDAKKISELDQLWTKTLLCN